jgi:kinesin family member 2/24
MVSKINPGSRSVTVEWYERGETKGKEVELDMLLQLNPELSALCEQTLGGGLQQPQQPAQQQQQQQHHPPSQLQPPMMRQTSQQHQPPQPANLSRVSTRISRFAIFIL